MGVADSNDAIDLSGQGETAGRRAGGRIDDGTFERLLQRDDLEFFSGIARGVAGHHGASQMPVALYAFVGGPGGAGTVDEGDDRREITVLVPQLQAVMDQGTEVQIRVLAVRCQPDDVAVLGSLSAIPEQRQHAVGRGHPGSAHRPPPSKAWGLAFASPFGPNPASLRIRRNRRIRP